MAFHVSVDERGIAELVIANPPVNALGSAAWAALAKKIEELGRDAAVRVLLIRADGRGFQAGVELLLPRAVRARALGRVERGQRRLRHIRLEPGPRLGAKGVLTFAVAEVHLYFFWNSASRFSTKESRASCESGEV